MTEQQMPAMIWVEAIEEDPGDTWYVRADIAERMSEALENVRGIISDAAMTGFNWKDGDWPDRLFASQQKTSAALSAFRSATQDTEANR